MENTTAPLALRRLAVNVRLRGNWERIFSGFKWKS